MLNGPRHGCRCHLSPLAGRGRIALAIRVRGNLREGGPNRLKNTYHIAQHIIVPESQDSIVALGEPIVANGVSRIVRMLSSINLNNESTFAAYEVDSVRSDRLLSDKLVALEPARAQSIPERCLGICDRSSQTP